MVGYILRRIISTVPVMLIVAVLVFLVAAYLLFGVVIHVVSIIFSTLVLVLAVVAVVWALKVLL